MITKKSQTQKGRRPPSLSTLRRLWRLKVLANCNNTCYLCGIRREPSHLEAHHVIHRSQSGLLKYDARNGVALCKGKCHAMAHRSYGADIIAKRLGPVFVDLLNIDRQTLKDHLAATGKTRTEWLWEQYERLRSNG